MMRALVGRHVRLASHRPLPRVGRDAHGGGRLRANPWRAGRRLLPLDRRHGSLLARAAAGRSGRGRRAYARHDRVDRPSARARALLGGALMVRVAEALGAAQHGRTTPVTVIVNRAARSAAGVPWSRVVDELRAHDLAPVLLRPATRAEAVAAARMAARRGVGVGVVVAA